MKSWRQANRAAKLAYDARWQRENADRSRVNYARWRAKRAEVADSDLTFEQWMQVLARWGFRCAYCGTQDGLGIDHVIPLSAGGSNAQANVVPCCKPCNSKKGVGAFAFRSDAP